KCNCKPVGARYGPPSPERSRPLRERMRKLKHTQSATAASRSGDGRRRSLALCMSALSRTALSYARSCGFTGTGQARGRTGRRLGRQLLGETGGQFYSLLGETFVESAPSRAALRGAAVSGCSRVQRRDRFNGGSTCEVARAAIWNWHSTAAVQEKSLYIMQETEDGGDKVLTEPALSLTVRNGEFAEQQIGVVDKIPLVKPYFKKKHGQRKLDAKCLRTLADPLLTTLLSSDDLVAGDGVFVPRNPSRVQRNICTAAVEKQARMSPVCLKDAGAVSGLMAEDTHAADMSDPAAELTEGEQKVTNIPRATIDTSARRFQPQARDSPAPSAVVAPCEGEKLNDIYTSESLQGANCLAVKEGSATNEIFQDKSEEASLDLVFELLTQLQYHTHQGDAVSVCVDFLQGVCVYGSDCAQHHTVLPYHWQIRRADTQVWQSISDESQEQLERLYCNPDNEQVRLKFLWVQALGSTQALSPPSAPPRPCPHPRLHPGPVPTLGSTQALSPPSAPPRPCPYPGPAACFTAPWIRVCMKGTSQSQQQISSSLPKAHSLPGTDVRKVHFSRLALALRGRVFMLDFSAMRVCDLEFDLVRRLSTPSSSVATPPNTSPTPSCLTTWKYYCRDNFGWREYSEPVVRLIEEASGRGLKEVRFITLQNQYILNIREGFQQNAVFGFRRQIKKRPLFMSSIRLSPYLQTLGGLQAPDVPGPQPLSPVFASGSAPGPAPGPFPETWVPMSPSQDFIQVPVSRDDRSYRTVYNLFHKTVSETKFRITKILRMQNPFLWEKYERKKEYMSRRMSEMDRLLNERHLFHGTSQDVVEGICKHNFDPRVCGKHATMFGQGSYFARKAAYSHNFSKRSPRGVHYMFLAKVLTGKFTVGNPTMRRPPPLCPRDPSSDLFDSCVDNWMDPQIFVIFNDDQSYPYFIIQYEEVASTVAI
ncbi:hypothetical protein P4O66_018737, partial [Electrophorus voltai]